MTIRSSSLIGLLIWVTASLCPSRVSAQAPACEPGGQDVANSPILAPVIYLTLPSFDGRGFGTVGDWCASEYIAAQLETLGLKPGANGSFFQVVPDPHSSDAPSMARNVVAVIEGSDPVLRNEVILVAAHHDHLSPDTAPD